MALGRKNKKGPGKSSSNDNRWVSIASVLESKNGNIYFNVEDYFGDLYFVDKETGDTYRLKSAAIMEPLESAPDFVQNVIRVNLDGDTVEKLEE